MSDTLHTQNGSTAGRIPPPLPTVTLPVSGYTVAFHRIGPFTQDKIIQKLRREQPAPEPPELEVELFDGTKEQQRNEADPDYLAAKARWERELEARAGALLFEVITQRLVVAVDVEAVAIERATLRLIDPDDEAAMSDTQVFVNHVLLAHADDIQALTRAVTGASQPTEEAVQAHVASFRG